MQLDDARPAPPPAGPRPKFVSHTHKRVQDREGGNHVVYWVTDEQGESVAAVSGHDPRGTGHFIYVNTPEMVGVAPPLKCTNRAAVLGWLSGFGAGNADVNVQTPDYEPEVVPRSSGGPGRKPMKRRAVDAAEGPPRRRTGQGRPPQDEHGISSEVQEAYKSYPELFQWVTAEPDEAVLKAFMQYARELSCSVSDEAPDPLGVGDDGTPLSWIPTSTCARILDDISTCDQVSLRLLQVSEIGAAARACVARGVQAGGADHRTLAGRSQRHAAARQRVHVSNQPRPIGDIPAAGTPYMRCIVPECAALNN